MRRIPRSILLLLVAAAAILLALVAHAEVDRDTRLRVARDARDKVARGESVSLWGQFNERMRAAVKDSASYVAMSASVNSQLGGLDSLMEEEVIDRDSMLVLRTRARFKVLRIPVVITVGVDTAGQIGTLHVRPDAGGKATEAPSAYLEYQPKAQFRARS